MKQIYHVARCGSTLMGSLLSTVTTCFLEPPHGIHMANTGDIIEIYRNSVVKFQSLSLMNPILLNGEKVFLYRPLLQHLFKIKSDKVWFKFRAKALHNFIKEPLLFNWNPKTDLELITYQWLCSVHEMNNHSDVLWIQTNDFLKNKKETMDLVCNHFNLEKVSDFSLTNINVKKLKLLGKNTACNIEIKNDMKLLDKNHGIIENSMCLHDTELVDLAKKVEKLFPNIKHLIYGTT